MLATMVEHVIGIDPDRDRVTASVMDTATTGEQASGVFGASRVGYDRLLKWASNHTRAGDRVWSVEGTGSYGVGVAGYLSARGEWVVEFGDPTPTRDGAKTDALDARRAARQVLGRGRLPAPRARGNREALRVLETTRRGAQTARVAAINELKALVVTAPVDLQDQLGGLTTAGLVAKCHRFRLRGGTLTEHTATKIAMRSVARRIKTLTTEIAELTALIAELVETVAPHLVDQPGVGPITAAQIYVAWSHQGRFRNEAAFARLAGVAPLEASSGQNRLTGSTATATEPSTKPSTPSSSPAPAPAPRPRPTSLNEPPKANPPRNPTLPQTLHRPPPLPAPREPTQPQHPYRTPAGSG